MSDVSVDLVDVWVFAGCDVGGYIWGYWGGSGVDGCLVVQHNWRFCRTQSWSVWIEGEGEGDRGEREKEREREVTEVSCK